MELKKNSEENLKNQQFDKRTFSIKSLWNCLKTQLEDSDFENLLKIILCKCACSQLSKGITVRQIMLEINSLIVYKSIENE